MVGASVGKGGSADLTIARNGGAGTAESRMAELTPFIVARLAIVARKVHRLFQCTNDRTATADAYEPLHGCLAQGTGRRVTGGGGPMRRKGVIVVGSGVDCYNRAEAAP
jgi:hypothetical protein